MKKRYCHIKGKLRRVVKSLLMLLVVAALILLPSEKAQAAVRDHILTDTVDPDGVTINLFDYWVTAQDEDGQTINRDTEEGGINQGFLKFGGKGDSNGINGWNRGPIYQGIVNPLLGEDGYPVLAEGSGESLAYLFNPDDVTYGDYKRQYEDVTGLFRVNTETGNYYYDSRENYAAFNKAENAFEVYPDWGMRHDEANSDKQDGYFFPFDGADEVFTETTDGKLEHTDLNCNDPRVNHFFGMTMTAEFIQPPRGLVTLPGEGTEGKPMVFSFSGDDDIWVFIDGVLVMDLGGIHNSAGGSIDFSTGIVTLENPNANSDGSTATSETTIKERYEAALEAEFTESGFSENTFTDNSYHTLQVFYLERGAGASNLKIDFNMKSRPMNSIYKMDHAGNGIGGVTFDLYAADEDYTITGNNPILTETTERNGRVAFLDGDGHPYDFTQGNANVPHYYVLKERGSPGGYRASGDIHLKYTENGQLLVDNKWHSGAMSNFSVTVTQKGGLVDVDGNPVDEDQGTTFAVIARKGKDGNWYPLTGSNAAGWYMSETNTWEDIINAAKQNPNIMEKENGLLTVTIDELPGDITEYYYINLAELERAKYVAVYYHTTGTLAQADAGNTVRLDLSEFTRDFSSNIWVANVKKQLGVQKVDEDGTQLPGAEFSLYKEEAMQDGTIPEEAEAYDTAITEENGMASFPSAGKYIEAGTYYLKETEAPTGYIANSALVKVIVDETGVYADAGDPDDGIRVHTGVGYLLKPMEKFGANDDIDATLHDIYAVSQTGTENGAGGMNWSEQTGTEKLHLVYGKEGNLLQYGPMEDGALYLTSDTGYIRARVYQCLEHGEKNKTELAGMDISSLFTGSMVVEVTNEKKTSTLDIKKTISGVGAETDKKEFAFTLSLKDQSGTACANMTVGYSGNGTVTGDTAGADENYTVTADGNGQIKFLLQQKENLQFFGLPEGVSYKVEEEDYTGHGYLTRYKITVEDQQGTLTDGRIAEGQAWHDAPPEVEFENQRNFHDFSFIKTDGKSSEQDKPLAGAGFLLYRWGGQGEADTRPLDIEGQSSSWQRVTAEAVVSGADGNVVFSGLIENVTYRLVETETPQGYITPAGQWNIMYVPAEDGSEPAESGWVIKVAADGTKLPPAFIRDEARYLLPNYGIQDIPSAGGRGGLFTGFAGTVLTGTAMLLLYAWMRQRKRKE